VTVDSLDEDLAREFRAMAAEVDPGAAARVADAVVAATSSARRSGGRRRPRTVGLAIAGLAAVAASAVVYLGTSVDPVRDQRPDHVVSQEEARQYAVEHLEGGNQGAGGVWIERNLADLLPNQRFSVDGGSAQPLAEDVVIGTITRAEGGAGYAVEGEDAPGGTVVPFDSDDAVWRVADLTITVDDSLGDRFDSGQEVRVGVGFDGGADTRTMLQGLEGREVLVVLDAPGFYQHDRQLYSIGHFHALLGFVAESGAVSFPLLGDDEQAFVGGLDTLEEIRAEAAERKPPLRVVVESGIPRIVE
jgi:hypothetical protein